MALEKTWQYQSDDAGTVLTNDGTVLDCARKTLWFLQAFLLNTIAMKQQNGTAIAAGAATGRGTILGSSDAATAGLDATNRWETTPGVYNAAKIVRAAAGVAHSWINFSIGGMHWVIDYVGAQDYQAEFWCAKTAFTGGSTTARPTSVDQFQVRMGGSSDTFSFSATGGGSGQVGPQKGHGRLSTAGDFFLFVSRDGFSVFNLCLRAGAIADAMAEDTVPYHAYFNFGATATPWAVASLQTTGHACRTATNGATVTNAQGVTPVYGGGVYALDAIDATNGKYRDYPFFLKTITPANSFRGRFPDWKLAVAVLLDGDLDNLTTIERMVVGDSWVPCRSAPSL